VSSLALILLLLLVAIFWLNSLRAREMAMRESSRLCREQGLQLLDQTVALVEVSLSWQTEGLRWRRTYEFSFSQEGMSRLQGRLTLRGLAVEYWELENSELKAELGGHSLEA
jgi:hypothetical protein